MAISAINFTKEMVRQGLTQDDKFFRRMLYYFELHMPLVVESTGQVAPGVSNSFMFPLIIPPESYSMDEPFAVEVTPTQHGGLYTEENGIIQRVIRIRGTTGFKPRMLKTYGALFEPNGPPSPMPTSLPGLNPSDPSHSRTLMPITFAELSGQRHFQYLQDSMFRRYADFKRDPATAKDTIMYFHNPKDDEHWRVVPNRFSVERDKSRRTLYTYNIELLVVGPANATADLDFDDKNIFDDLNNALYMAQLGAALVAGGINDLTALADDLGTFLSNITVLIDSLTTIVNATDDYVSGTESLINVPYAWHQSLMELMDEAADTASQEEQIVAVPQSAINIIRRTIEGLELIGAHPESFETPNSDIAKSIKDRQEIRRSVDEQTINDTLESESPTSFDELEAVGTALTPGEAMASEGEIKSGGEVKNFRSLREITVGQNDTLATLASQYMGDARLWQHIAIANGLKPPYVNDQATLPLGNNGADEVPFGSSMGRGAKILIPSNAASPLDYPLLPVLGTQIEESIDNHLLGVDALLEVVHGAKGSSRALYDVAVNTELGSTDVKLAEGMENISQVALLRLAIEYGTDLLYKQVGLKRIVGLNFHIADLTNARYRIRESLTADARIAAVQNLQFEQEEGKEDNLQTEMDAELRGFPQSRPIQVSLT